METEHKPKKHRFRSAYTIHVMSDNPDSAGRRYHFSAGKSQAMIILGFLASVLLICYIVYSAISLRTLYRYQARQNALTEELRAQNAELASTNNALQNEVTQLSRAFNQKLEAEHAAEEEAYAMTLPKGYPLSGTASISEESVGNDTEPILHFSGIEIGATVVASGSGTVLEVTQDATYGYRIVISHNDGYESIYRNGGVPIVAIGDTVNFGQDLFRIGQGNAFLGYQIRHNGTYIHPEELLEING